MEWKRTLETNRLWMRPFEESDVDAAYLWASEPTNVRYMAWGPNDREQTLSFIQSAKPGYDFAVVLKDSGAVIGSCGIYPDAENDTATLGWILHRDYWKCGYGTEFGTELIRYGFEDLKVRRITAYCAAVNAGSYKLMERIGMRREALHRKDFWARIDHEWIDKAVYAVLSEEYFGRE